MNKWAFPVLLAIGTVTGAGVTVGLAVTTPRATSVATLDGNPLAGPTNSDCQLYKYGNGTVAINCPVKYIPIVAADGPHTIQPTDWGQVLVASGGGIVQFLLPTPTTIGRNTVGFATDSLTGFSVTAQAPTTMQGSPFINNGVLTVGPNADGWAGLSGNIWQVNVR